MTKGAGFVLRGTASIKEILDLFIENYKQDTEPMNLHHSVVPRFVTTGLGFGFETSAAKQKHILFCTQTRKKVYFDF